MGDSPVVPTGTIPRDPALDLPLHQLRESRFIERAIPERGDDGRIGAAEHGREVSDRGGSVSNPDLPLKDKIRRASETYIAIGTRLFLKGNEQGIAAPNAHRNGRRGAVLLVKNERRGTTPVPQARVSSSTPRS